MKALNLNRLNIRTPYSVWAVDDYAAVIVQSTNPHFDQIIQDFNNSSAFSKTNRSKHTGIYHICENSRHDLGNPKFFDYLCTKLYL